jgi:benzoate/toluate 1,2-dioxygenase beta subunit
MSAGEHIEGLRDQAGRMGASEHVHREVASFLHREARLLDGGGFEEWLTLYEPQGIYWMPSRPDQTDPLGVASIIYEDHAILSIRVQRLLEARALVLTPMPLTTHLVSNVEVLAEEGDAIEVESAFLCVEHQADRQKIYSGRQVHHLTRSGDSFRIRLKRVALTGSAGVLSPITIPL